MVYMGFTPLQNVTETTRPIQYIYSHLPYDEIKPTRVPFRLDLASCYYLPMGLRAALPPSSTGCSDRSYLHIILQVLERSWIEIAATTAPQYDQDITPARNQTSVRSTSPVAPKEYG
jgi:hypothetical protein